MEKTNKQVEMEQEMIFAELEESLNREEWQHFIDIDNLDTSDIRPIPRFHNSNICFTKAA